MIRVKAADLFPPSDGGNLGGGGGGGGEVGGAELRTSGIRGDGLVSDQSPNLCVVEALRALP